MKKKVILIILTFLVILSDLTAQKVLSNERVYLVEISKDYKYLVVASDNAVFRYHLADGSLDKQYSWATTRGRGLYYSWTTLATMSADASKVTVVCGVLNTEQASLDLNTGKMFDWPTRIMANHGGFAADGMPIGIGGLFNGWDPRPKVIYTLQKENNTYTYPRIDEGDVRVFGISGDKELIWYSPKNKIKNYYRIDELYLVDPVTKKSKKRNLPRNNYLITYANNVLSPSFYHKDYLPLLDKDQSKESLYSISRDKIVQEGVFMQISDQGNVAIRKGCPIPTCKAPNILQAIDINTGQTLGDTISFNKNEERKFLRINEETKEAFVLDFKNGVIYVYDYTNWSIKRAISYKMNEAEFLLAWENKKAESEKKSKALIAAAPPSFKQYMVNFDALPNYFKFSVETVSGRDVSNSPHAARAGGVENAVGIIGDCDDQVYLLSLLVSKNSEVISYAPVIRIFKKNGEFVTTVTLGQTIDSKITGRTHEVTFSISKGGPSIQFNITRKVNKNTYSESKMINLSNCLLQ